MKTPRIALIHDWLTGMRGGEKVFELICELFPNAPIYTLLHVPGKVSRTIESHPIHTSPLQKIPGIAKLYRHLLPLMPWAIEQFDLSDYDVLISTSHCVAKGAIPAPNARHWCYCFTPMRYIWDQYEDYFGPEQASLPVRMVMRRVRSRLQSWDLNSLSRVTTFIADCKNIQERIHRIYKRESEVLYPPANVEFFSQLPLLQTSEKEDFYLIVSALAPYKKIDVALEACHRLKRRLIVIGEGQDKQKLQKYAGPLIQFLGWQSDETIRDYYRKARALLFPGEEDFGLTPIEANAAGCPVIALGRGGVLETVIAEETALLYPSSQVESLMEAMEHFEKRSWDPQRARRHAAHFSYQRAKEAFQTQFVDLLK